jgi:hypothetical protein
VNAARLEVFRKVVLIFGLWYLASAFVIAPLGFAANAFPSYIASSTRPGSQVAMYLIGSIPQVLGAFAAGFSSVILLGSTRMSWALFLSSLFVVFHLASGWSFRWQWMRMEGEVRLGMILAGLLIGAACMLGFVVSKRRRVNADAAPA